MNKMFIVLKHEFRQKIRSKAFIILTFIAPLLMAALIAVPVFISVMNEGIDKQIVIVDRTGKLGKYFAADTGKRTILQSPAGAKSANQSFGPSLHLTIITSVTPSSADSLKALLLKKKISGYLEIPGNAITDSTIIATLRVTNANDFTVEEFLSTHYTDLKNHQREIHIYYLPFSSQANALPF